MNSKKKINIKAGLLALLMSANLSLVEIPVSYAASLNEEVIVVEYKNTEGEIETINCKEYEVKKGDNLSNISRRMTEEYGIKPTTMYWPVLAYLNNYPRMIHPGNVLVYPETLDEAQKLYDELKEKKWIAKYIINNNVYGKRRQEIKGAFMTNYTISKIIDEVYGEGASKNGDLVSAYLNAVNMETYDDRLDKKLNNEEVFRLTEWLPTEKELTEYGYKRRIKK